MENKICTICDKEYTPTYSKQQCCSRECAAILRGRNQTTEKTLKYCEICGKEIYVTPSSLHRKCCSRECSDKLRTTQVKKVCEICGKEFSVIKCRENTAKYCSIACQRKSLNGDNNCVCPICGKPFHSKPYHLKRYGHSLGNYCSRECLTEARKILFSGSGNHQYGLKGPLNASYKGEVIPQKNHKLIEQMVYRPNHPFCSKSGRVKLHRLLVEENYHLFDLKYFIKINGKYYLSPKISVHHKDGNHNNNIIENLIPCTKGEHQHYHKLLREQIKNNTLNTTAVLKQGELLGSPEVGNQQPSTPLTKCEGSETRC